MIPTAIISFGTWLQSKLIDKGFDEIFTSLSTCDELDEKFLKALKKTSKKLQDKYPDVLGGSIESFFKGDQIFSEVVKLLFRNSNIDIKKLKEYFDTDTLPENFIEKFITELKKELLKDVQFDKILSNKEIYISIQGLSRDINLIASNSDITAYELKRISKTLSERIGKSFSFSEFVQIYSKNAINNLSQVNFIGLGIDISFKKNRKNLQDIFVLPQFKLVGKKGGIMKYSEDYDDFFDNSKVIAYKDLFDLKKNNFVVLGNPGSGKSVLIKSIICEIISNKGIFNNQDIYEHIPFRVELRKYLEYKKENKVNIIKYLAFLLEKEYSIHNITENILHDIISFQKCILFFDGLDEIFDINDKVEIKNDIENFHNVYKTIKSVVTSRVIGYEEANLNDNFFELLIKKFNSDQVEEYLNKWYLKEEENTEIRETEIQGFLQKKNEIDKELLFNPLLLSLIVILYRNILKLPESKLEIYQSCTRTLVDKWDASKDLKIDLEDFLYKNKDKLFADLAFWQYLTLSSEELTVSYEKAKRTVKKTIQEKLKIEEEYEAETLAERFMVYAQKRSIYFENNFTHKTFLEYYSAYWIYSNLEKKYKIEERDELILKYCDNTFWFIVLELLINLIDKDQADNEVIDNLIIQLSEKKKKSLPFILTILPSIKNCSASVIDDVIRNTVIELHNLAKGETKTNNPEINTVFQSFQVLYRNKNFRVSIGRELGRLENLGKDLDILYSIYVELHQFEERNFEVALKEQYFEIIKGDPFLYVSEYFRYSHKEKIDINEFLINYLDYFGAQSSIKSLNSKFSGFSYLPALDFYFAKKFTKKIASFDDDLALFENKGLSRKFILKYLSKASTNYIIMDLVSLKNLFLCFENETNLLAKNIILLLIIKSMESGRSIRDEKIPPLSELTQNNKVLNLLNEIGKHSSWSQKHKKINAFFN